jgi:hypothetical protein
MKPRNAAVPVLLVACAAACGPGPARPAAVPPARTGPASHARDGWYSEILPFGHGEVAWEKAVRTRRPAMVLFTADG